MEGDTAVTANFTLWPTRRDSMLNISACEVLEDGGVMTTDKLSFRSPRNDRNCYVPFGTVAAPAVSTIPTDVNLAALTMGTTSRVFLSQEGCVPGAMADIVTSERFPLSLPHYETSPSPIVVAPPDPTTTTTTATSTIETSKWDQVLRGLGNGLAIAQWPAVILTSLLT